MALPERASHMPVAHPAAVRGGPRRYESTPGAESACNRA